ncbi:MAG: tocopherol cyclase family protein [Methanobrevibacter sp.]|jgi:hypothetical protein|nr:tocopherol cyclase family protein [Methanobrevibacter sp.]MDO5827079.1 tocopherol cyclase family protein [Methanobrevibacter sp.]
MNKSDYNRDLYMLRGPLAKKGYDWWWHSLTAYNKETGEEKPFFIEYYTCNPALAEDEPTLGQDPVNKANGKWPSYFMMKCGTWGKNPKQMHNFYSMKEFSCPEDRLDIKVGPNTLTEKHMSGRVIVTEENAANPGFMCDAGEMSWDLDIDKQIAFNVGYGANSLFRKLNAFEMVWHAEGIKTQYSGTITLDGVEYEVIPEKSYGYADKNWGSDFTTPWLWISSCNLTSLITGEKLENSAFEAGGGRPVAFGVKIPRKLLIFMYHEGKEYDFNFAHLWKGIRQEFDFEEGEVEHTWKIKCSNWNYKLEMVLHCKRDEMLFINYEHPDGIKRYNRLWNGGNGYGEIKLFKKDGTLIDHIKMENAGCEYGEYDAEYLD